MLDWLNELLRRLLFLPPQASTLAARIDRLHYFVISVTLFGAAAVAAAALYFLIRYRRGRVHTLRPEQGARPANARLEIATIFALFTLFIGWWVIGFRQFNALRSAPPNSLRIYVTAKQWMWKFADPAGAHSIAYLVVPAGRPVELLLTSRDVIHSFYVPDFRIKQDVLPGRYTSAWFQSDAPGTHQILCAEYCGTNHSVMRGEVIVLSASDYARWRARALPPTIAAPIADEPGRVDHMTAADPLTAAQNGAQIAARAGCLRCHSVDGTPYIGPTWAGLYGAMIPLSDGSSVVADAEYLTESMMYPLEQLHAGFTPVMPSYQGRLRPAEVAAIIEYIRTLEPAAEPAPPPLGRVEYNPQKAQP